MQVAQGAGDASDSPMRTQISRLVRPLRVHLSVVIVLLLIGVSIPIMWLSYEQGKRAAIAKAEDQMGMQSQHTIDRYRAILGDGYSVVTIASVIERLLSQPNVDLDIKIAFLIKALEGSPYVNNIYVGYPDGGYLQAANAERNQAWIKVSDAPPETVFVVRTIERLSEPPLSIWRFLDRSGKVLAQRSSHDVNFDPRKRPWYKEALKAGGPVSVGPYVTAATQSLTLTMAVPMAKNKSAIAGVDVLLETISRSLAHDLVSEHARGFVFDSHEKLIVHSDSAIMGRILENYGAAVRDGSGPSASDPVVEAARQVLNEEYDESGRTVAFLVDGEPYVARISTVGFSDLVAPNTIVLAAPVEDFLGPSLRLLFKNLAIAGLFLTGGILAALLVARLISRALLALSEDARHIGNLEFAGRTSGTSWISEINTLTSALTSAREAIKTFALYVPRELVRKIVTAGQATAGAAVRQEVTVLFTDIRDFTTISEQHSPEDVVGMLSDYFQLMNEIVVRHNGVIIQYLGDSIYAMWNAPTPDPTHVDDACRCALDIKATIDEFNQKRRSEGQPELVTRYGIHTGVAVVGSVGARTRQQYTAMGDTVNVASRLEGMNKQFGTTILASGAVRDQACAPFVFKSLGVAQAKGRSAGLAIFELVGRPEN